MKLAVRNWPWLGCLLAMSLICATYLLAQTQTTPTSANTQATNNIAMKVTSPGTQETADSAQLIDAINAGDLQTSLEILHNYGIGDNTLLAMATDFVKSPSPVELQEPFLQASVGALALADRPLKTNVLNTLDNATTTLGYGLPVWMPRRPDTWAIASYDSDFAQCPVAPIMVLNVRLNDPCFIRYFELYNRYASDLHSVVLNGPNLSNAKLAETNYVQANLTLNALFQLIKAREPNAFVWLNVVKEDNHSDEQWLQAMKFRPDGLQISNLRQFHSPFAETRARYEAIVGTNMPMMVAGFEGYSAVVRQQAQMLTNALENDDTQAEAAAMAQLGGIGTVAGQNLSEVETNLQSLGYCGISVQWTLLEALANTSNAAPPNMANLIDPRAGLLDIYYGEKDYAHTIAFAANMISNSAPGDLNWTVGKLYDGIALLSQTPPDTSDAMPILNQILAFNFTNLPGRDHYILGAVKWQIYAARLAGDTQLPPQLVQWVQNQPLRADLKSEFLEQYSGYLSPATSQ